MLRTALSGAKVILPTLLALIGLASCGGADPGPCTEGTADCPCAPGEECLQGLVCSEEGTCVTTDGTGGGATDGSRGTASGGSATGGATTGGSSSMCTGTPTGSCDDPLCDTFPGCTSTEGSSCAGTESPCSAFDGDTSAWSDQWGCERSSLEAAIQCTTPTIAPGTYYLGAIFDPDDEVPKTDESDNVVIANTTDPLTIEAP